MYIAVIYCSTSVVVPGREIEKLADCEIGDTAAAVKSALENGGHRVDLVRFDPQQAKELCKYEWIFNLAESICGSSLTDHQVAAMMEEMGIPFTGSGSATLRTCLYKSSAKAHLQKYGIRTPRFETVNPGDKANTKLEFPLIVKPDHEDGSIGIQADSVVQSVAELVRKIEEIHLVYGETALIEEYIDGREITASVIGNGDNIIVFPLSEITFSDDYVGPRILTYEEKWVEESQAFKKSAAHCPCTLDEWIQGDIKSVAGEVVKILECRDYTRVDLRLKGDRPYVIEVNPNPCINPIETGYIRAGNAYGLSYDEIINDILRHSILRGK